jgi:hypothetical protein
MAQTDSITESMWVKIDQYKTAGMISRNNGTTDGWKFYLNSSGQVVLAGARAADDIVTSYQSVPLNKWTHVSASINTTTTTGVITINGISVPVSYSNNANTGFATPTTAYLIGATNSASPTDFFSGKLAQPASFSAVIPAATILTYMSQGLLGTETNLISAFSLSGASGATDLNTTNNNTLTANASATTTTADSPFGGQADSPFGGQADGTISSTLDYGIVQAVTYSTNTTVVFQVPEGCTVPTSGGVTSVSYSSLKAPYGFPAQRNKWTIFTVVRAIATQNSPVNGTWYNMNISITAPIGEWSGLTQYTLSNGRVGASVLSIWGTLSTTTNSETDKEWSTYAYIGPSNDNLTATVSKSNPLSVSTQTVYYLLAKTDDTTTNINIRGDSTVTKIALENAYL